MSTTIITINSSDAITNSRADLNSNFSSINTNKIETSVLDTDTALTANSDLKVATQKATKAYTDNILGTNASTTVKGVVEEATVAEVAASTATGGTGARLFINPSSTKSTSAGAGDVGKLPSLNASGQLDGSFLPIRGVQAIGSQTKDISVTTTTNIAHGLGFAPKRVELTCNFASAANCISNSIGRYIGSTERSNSMGGSNALWNALQTFSIFYDQSNYNSAAITVDATNIILTWTKTGTPTGTATINWEAIT